MVVGKVMASGVKENGAPGMEMWKPHWLFGGECCAVALWLVSHSSEVPHTHQVNGMCARKKEEVFISRHNLDFDISIFSVALLHKSWGIIVQHR